MVVPACLASGESACSRCRKCCWASCGVGYSISSNPAESLPLRYSATMASALDAKPASFVSAANSSRFSAARPLWNPAGPAAYFCVPSRKPFGKHKRIGGSGVGSAYPLTAFTNVVRSSVEMACTGRTSRIKLPSSTSIRSPSTAEVLFSVVGCMLGFRYAVYTSYALVGSLYFSNDAWILVVPEEYWQNSPGLRPASFQIFTTLRGASFSTHIGVGWPDQSAK